MMKTSNSRRGFTLVELLVVIGIIAILAAISFAAAGPAIRQAQLARCTTNMHTIGGMFMGYVGDHDGVLPQRKYNDGTGYWQVIGSYSSTNIPNKDNSVFVCPTQTANDFPNEPSYGMNWYYDNASMAKVDKPDSTIMVAETLGTSGTGSNRADKDSGDPGELDPTRHTGKANYLFFDGHIERMTFDDTMQGDPSGPGMWGTDLGNHDLDSPQ